MKRLIVSIFLLLYVYNFAGYLAVFSVLQYQVRKDMKLKLKESVPQSELILVTFHTASLEGGLYPIQWVDQNEFRYNGGMYDIVRSHTSEDTTYFQCVNDVQEEVLFSDLNKHVQKHMGNSEEQTKLDSFRDVFKNSFPYPVAFPVTLVLTGMLPRIGPTQYHSIDPEVPFHPPRLSQEAKTL
jgi:hypothetical protein